MTPAENLPRRFKEALAEYATSIKKNFSALIRANPEDQLRAPVQALLPAVGKRVITRSEAQLQEVSGRRDIGVAVDDLLCGYVELKAPGKGAGVSRFRGADKAQWEKFKAIPNLIYTDGSQWGLYRSGIRVRSLVNFGDVTTEGADAIPEDKAAELHVLLLDFLNWQPITPG